jgi:hypothetical protein
MRITENDLLPQIFDGMVYRFAHSTFSPPQRVDFELRLVQIIQASVVEAVRNKGRQNDTKELIDENSREKVYCNYLPVYTSDRLSGSPLSRQEIIEKLAPEIGLPSDIVQIALLLVEARIDLALSVSRIVEIGNLVFYSQAINPKEGASWCQDILSLTLSGIAQEQQHSGKQTKNLDVIKMSLEASVALRQPVRYEIYLKDTVVETRTGKEAHDLNIRIVHISDLHFVDDIGGSTPWYMLQAPHSEDKMRSLAMTLKRLEQHHVLVATGDLSTNGTETSLRNAQAYFQRETIPTKSGIRAASFGLFNAGVHQILLPGNHDRFDEKLIATQNPDKNDNFERILLRNEEIIYPYVDVFQMKSSITRNGNKEPPTLLFFVFDSNLKADTKSNPKDLIGAIARGEITKEDLESFQKQVKEASQGKVKDKDGKEYELDPSNTIRIALLHHHPIRIPRKPSSQKTRIVRWFKGIFKEAEEWTTALNGSEDFLRTCYESGIQLVLFGHDHHQQYETWEPNDHRNPEASKNVFGEVNKSLHLFCCPSTLEIDATPNGFYTFDIHDKDRITWQLYSKYFDETKDLEQFRPDPKKQGEINLKKGSSGLSVLPFNPLL